MNYVRWFYRERIFSWGGLAVVLLMAAWFYLGAMWGMEENTREKGAPKVDPRMMHCFLVGKDRTLCHIELQSWDSRWGFEYGKIRE